MGGAEGADSVCLITKNDGESFILKISQFFALICWFFFNLLITMLLFEETFFKRFPGKLIQHQKKKLNYEPILSKEHGTVEE